MTLERNNVDRETDDVTGDDFLLREGFDLLASYRAIRSHELREEVLAMIVAMAAAQGEIA